MRLNKGLVSVMKQLISWMLIGLWCVGAHTAPSLGELSHQPNVIVILADDMGWSDVGYHGSEIRTPNLDNLAQAGVRFDRFYVQPACSPTRASLMTGRNNQSLGIYAPLSKLAPTGLPLSVKILPQYFKDAGYQTYLVGKWHLGFRQADYRPTERGYDHFYGNLTGGIGFWDHVHGGGLDWQRNGVTLREEGYATHLQLREAQQLIQNRDQDRPFFLSLHFNAPHLPNEAPEETVQSYENITDPLRRIHAAMVTELDMAMGELLHTLADEGLESNTIIWFMSDNGGLNPSAFGGPMLQFAGLIDWVSSGKSDIPILEFIRTNVLEGRSSNFPLRGGKQSVFEGGTRVPALLYWKGQISPQRFQSMVTVQDVLPTLVDIARISRPDVALDGQSIWPYVSGGVSMGEYVATPFLTSARDGQAYYEYPWKLIAHSSDELRLFRLDDDPEEQFDLVKDHPDIARALQAKLVGWPRGASVHVPLYRSLLDPDFFGGEEDRKPWAETFD